MNLFEVELELSASQQGRAWPEEPATSRSLGFGISQLPGNQSLKTASQLLKNQHISQLQKFASSLSLVHPRNPKKVGQGGG